MSDAEPRRRALFLLAALALSLAVYRPALSGPFVSDDLLYVADNVTLHGLGRESLPSLFDPVGAPALEVGIYAPLALLAHGAEWRVFGAEVRGYHLVNLALHALCATLLLALFERSGIGRGLATFAAAAFLLHPANVEAVAWISQLKSVLALALALGALLALERRPLVATLLFAAALLAKATAAFALPMAAGLAWAGAARAGAAPRWRWLAGWTLLVALHALPQLALAREVARPYAPPHADLAATLRFVAWIGWRYASMAFSGLRTSAFHEPGPVGWSSPGWALGVALGLALLARIARSLRRRTPEAGFWLGALAGYAPVSQLVPFYFALGDRYLYFMLPGALGAAALVVQERVPAPRPALRRAAAALGLAALAAFAWLSHQRAALWRDDRLLLRDAAEHYPDGGTAHFVRAVALAQRGRPEEAVAALRASAERGYHFMHSFNGDPKLASLHGRPDFEALIHELARIQLAYAQQVGFDTPQQLRAVAGAQLYLGEYDQAIESYERAIRMGGPLRDALLAELMEARARRARARGEGAAPDRD